MEVYLPLILDGATGTELQKVGFTGEVCAEQWLLDNPEAIIELQKRYIAAGSNVVYTPTFGGNMIKLEENGIFNRTAEYNRRLAGLSQEAAEGKALVAGDIAPTGLFVTPLGYATFDDLLKAYEEQVKGLEEAGVDLYVIETMMTLSDARAAITAVKKYSSKPVIVSFTCDENGKTLTGGDVEAALVIMQSMGANVFGLNCSVGPKDMVGSLKKLSRYAEIPLAAKPNAGKPEMVNGKTVYNCEPTEFEECIPLYAECGVQLFGGCCGTDERYISTIRTSLGGLDLIAPDPKVKDKIICATEKHVFEIDPSEPCGNILEVNKDLPEAIETENESPSSFISVRLNSLADAELLTDNMYSMEKPLCIVCDDPKVLEKMLKSYQGRALYEGNIDRDTLEGLSKKYGLIY
ncbi:MAG: homocysteine S-methyltransferase family protein [Oscillospiraceae bacterium]|nr:homocysteine S-methyltransferase family protein [Oscillospiraceae bacterium]